ncbi:hypothetical protein PG993_002319 [Apiospora rasikravindrae]|uniref:MACPF domain-containing protein n=1 Tax=Apiospora rasikravindrae TaxID=990691 RepID=A0ABR1TWB1_9PEZI
MSKPVLGDDDPTPVVNTDSNYTPDADLSSALLHFCNKDGAIVDDSWTIKEYLRSIVEAEPTSGQILDVFLKKAIKRTNGIKPPDWDPGYPDSAPPPNTNPGNGDNTSNWDNSAWRADAFAGDRKYPADLREKEWAIVAHNNSLFYGLTIIRGSSEDGKVPIKGIDRAKLPAFRFKARNIPAYELSNDPAGDVELSLHIPDFIVDDRSDVSVFETNNEFQSSMAKSSFSQLDIEAAISGGAFGMEFGASAGYGKKESSSSSETTMKESQKLHIQYSFPRVTLNLDEYNLEMTPQCIDALAKLRDEASLTAFLETYGEFFTTRVQLGGRLYSSDEMTKTMRSNVEEAKQSMKAGASASFKTAYAEGSASSKKGSGTTEDTSQASADLERSLCWEASGGDSLLCNNPSAWCPTVASFYNWRTTKVVGPDAWSSGSYGDQGALLNVLSPQASEVGEVGFWNFKYPSFDRLGLKTVHGNDVYEAKYGVLYKLTGKGDVSSPLYFDGLLHNLVGAAFPKPHNALATPSGGFVKFLDAGGADRQDQPVAADAHVTLRFYPDAQGPSAFFLAPGDGYLVTNNLLANSPILTLEDEASLGSTDRKMPIVMRYQPLQ